ncbi:MAG: VanZ family protein [Candidatus Cloacimonetes bacterium]|jgi:VanZ family protein|nr:VanZ family protein [Candidatus Cloacimonadota bacterium]NLN85284.1 VanZ family protein [Candidatus Cloacimonadota bacterium]
MSQNLSPKPRNKATIRFVLPVVLWVAVIWTVSSLPGRHLPSGKIVGFDKVAHFSIYFVLGILTNRLLKGFGIATKRVWWIYLILVVSAALDELHQYFIPQRSVSVWDFAANAAGLGTAFAVFWIVRDRS